MTIKPTPPVKIIRQEQPAKPAQAVKPPAIINSVPVKPRINAALLISRSLEEVRRFEKNPHPGFNTNITDARVIETKIEPPLSIFSQVDQARQYQRRDGNTWIKIASIFGGYQCFIVRPADPQDSFDQGAWYMVRC
ncbi:hypothetical protein [Sulfuriflexus mobilis]|uniref:hypothetical protein n=1 Tax=Sulfuriflexus mobilis TaxID=1811807 RepID=UPI000F81A311|nr:hypothetical protein [Sulfuriflexus mobilis]